MVTPAESPLRAKQWVNPQPFRPAAVRFDGDPCPKPRTSKVYKCIFTSTSRTTIISSPAVQDALRANGAVNDPKEQHASPSHDTGGRSRASRGAIKTNDFNCPPRRVYALRRPPTQAVRILYSTRPSPLRFLNAFLQT